MWKRFIVYGLLGICMEIFWGGLWSLCRGDLSLTGSTCVWMFPIYGLGILFEPVHNKVRNLPLILRGGIYVLLIYTIEFTTGMFLKLVLGFCPWNYTLPLSPYGLISLCYLPVWFIVGLGFEVIHDLLTVKIKMV